MPSATPSPSSSAERGSKGSVVLVVEVGAAVLLDDVPVELVVVEEVLVDAGWVVGVAEVVEEVEGSDDDVVVLVLGGGTPIVVEVVVDVVVVVVEVVLVLVVLLLLVLVVEDEVLVPAGYMKDTPSTSSAATLAPRPSK